jgi:hypothetical protein
VIQVNREQRDALSHAVSGHPSIEQLMAEQGTGTITDVALLHGDFWPEEESVEEFVATIREWRGQSRRQRSRLCRHLSDTTRGQQRWFKRGNLTAQ